MKGIVKAALRPLGLEPAARLLWRAVRHPRQAGHDAQVWIDYQQLRRRRAYLVNAATRPTDGRIILIANLFSDAVGVAKFEALLGKAFQLRGYRPMIITTHDGHREHRYFHACGLDEFVYFDDALARLPDPAANPEGSAILRRIYQTVEEVEGLTYRGAYVGRHALSSLSMHLRQGRLDLADEQVRTLLMAWLADAMRSAQAADAVLEEIRPAWVLLREKGYVWFGEIFDAALNRGTDVITWNSGQRPDTLMLKRYRPATRHQHPFSLSKATWDAVRAMPWTEHEEARLLAEFRTQYADGVRFQGEPLQVGKRHKPPGEVRRQLGLDATRPTAVIFSHVLWDGTVSYGTNLFPDYEEWLVETVKAACENPRVNWVIKFHPANLWKAKSVGHTGELWDRVVLRQRVGPLPPHISVMDPDTDINTFALFDVADYCLTVRGTIGIEMACWGIRVFTAGTGRYSGMGFTEDSQTPADYLRKVKQIERFPRLNAYETELARRYAYGLYLLRPWRMESFAWRYLPVQRAGEWLNPNLVILPRSEQTLAAADDLRRFVRWAAEGVNEDYLAVPIPMATRTTSAVASGRKPRDR